MAYKCLVVDDELFSREVVKQFISRTETLNLIGECVDAESAVIKISELNPDIVFLDVEMPGMSGIDLVQQLENIPQIIMITSRQEYAVKAFEFSLTDYLVKPIEYNRFLKAVGRAIENLKSKTEFVDRKENDIYVKADGKLVRLSLQDILFVEALSDYVIINTPNKKLIVHSTMKGMEKKLASDNFSRVHRSYIVNMHKIDTIQDAMVIMPSKNIPIGASYKSKFLEQLNFL